MSFPEVHPCRSIKGRVPDSRACRWSPSGDRVPTMDIAARSDFVDMGCAEVCLLCDMHIDAQDPG